MISSEPRVINDEDIDDLFGHYDKIAFIKTFIEENVVGKGFLTKEYDRMIALYGGWGSGKSTIMKTLCESENPELQLDQELIKPIIFEAWRYEGDRNLPLSLFHFLGREICGGREGWNEKISIIDELRYSIQAFFRGFSGKVGLGASGYGSNNAQSLLLNIELQYDKSKADEYYEKKIEELKEKMSASYIYKKSYFEQIEELKSGFKMLNDLKNENKKVKNKKLVVFIDDLDRCESENVIELLTAIKLFFTYADDIVFVVGVDKTAVMRALKSKYHNDEEKAEEYLEKIFPMNFTCDIRYLEKYDKVIEYSGIKNERLKRQIHELVDTIQFTNPRHLQRYLNKWKAVERLWEASLKDDEKDYEIFLYCWYAYLFEFERELFDNTTNIELKISKYCMKINRYKVHGGEPELSEIFRGVKPSWLYLLPFPKNGEYIDLLGRISGGRLSKIVTLRNKNFGLQIEGSIFDKILDAREGFLVKNMGNERLTGAEKVEKLNDEIDYQTIITTIQTIF